MIATADRPGKPPKKLFNFRMDQDLFDALAELRDDFSQDKTEIVSDALKRYLKSQEFVDYLVSQKIDRDEIAKFLKRLSALGI